MSKNNKKDLDDLLRNVLGVKRPVGRPRKIDAAMMSQIGILTRFGYTDAEIAKHVGIHRDTITNFKHVNQEFFSTIKDLKTHADDLVERSLLQRATGFYFDEVVRSEKDGVRVTRKYIAPESTSMIFWLKNRQPARWRDVKAVQVNDVTERPVNITVQQIDEIPDGREINA